MGRMRCVRSGLQSGIVVLGKPDPMKNCAGVPHTSAVFSKHPVFTRLFEGIFLPLLRDVSGRMGSGFPQPFWLTPPPKLRGPYTHALTFSEGGCFSVLFDGSDIDLLRLTGFLKNLPIGQEEKYSLRLLTPSVLGPLQEYGYLGLTRNGLSYSLRPVG